VSLAGTAAAAPGANGERKALLQVIIGSTRPGRVGPAVAQWVLEQAEAHAGFDVELVDLADVDLPLLDEPAHPRLQQYTHAHTQRWSEIVSRADAFVFVTAEYNHAYPAALKNALDYLSVEWAGKPAAITSYGGVSAGLRAATALKPVLSALRITTVPDAVSIPFVRDHVANDEFVGSELLDLAAQEMLGVLRDFTSMLSVRPR
jgi:NAD(P)H-dependent FMN reductase